MPVDRGVSNAAECSDWSVACICSLCKNTRKDSGRRTCARISSEPAPGIIEETFEPPTFTTADKRCDGSSRQDEVRPRSERRRHSSDSDTILSSLHCGGNPTTVLDDNSHRRQRSYTGPAGSGLRQSPNESLCECPATLTSFARPRSCEWQSFGQDTPRRRRPYFGDGKGTGDCDGSGDGSHCGLKSFAGRARGFPRQNWSADHDDPDSALPDDREHCNSIQPLGRSAVSHRGGRPQMNCMSRIQAEEQNASSSNSSCLNRQGRRSRDIHDTLVDTEGPKYSKQTHVDFEELNTDNSCQNGSPDIEDGKRYGRHFCDVNENRRRALYSCCGESYSQCSCGRRTRRHSDSDVACTCHARSAANSHLSFFQGSFSSKKRDKCAVTNNNANRHGSSESCCRETGDKSNCRQMESTDSMESLDTETEEDVKADLVSRSNLEPSRQAGVLATSLCEMWRRHRLCDVVLKVQGHEFAAHKLIIAAFSDTFAHRYCETDSVGASAVSPLHIDVPGTSPAALHQVLRYLYTGHISLGPDNVGYALAAAAFLHIGQVVQLCKEILLHPDADTVIPYCHLVEKYHLVNDTIRFYDFICEHFPRVSRSRAWRALSFGQILDYLSEDNLNVDRELDVFQAAVSWIEADRPNRLPYAADLIGCVRFAFITPDEIAKHVETKRFLFQGHDGKELLLCIYRHHALQTCGCKHGERLHRLTRRKYSPSPPIARNINTSARARKTSSSDGPPACAPTLPLPPAPIPPRPDVILALGGVNPFQPESEAQVCQVEQFNPRSNHWSTLTRLPDGRHHHGAVVVGQAVYVIGGSVLDDLNISHLCNPTASCYRYHVMSGQWSAIAPLNTARMYHATALLNGTIFAVAGQSHHSRHLASVESYRGDVDEWEFVSEVGEARIGVALAAHHGQLFAVGGYLETQHEHVVRATVEVYDNVTRKWKNRSPLPTPRCHAGLVVCMDKLYLIGGSAFPLDSSTVCSLSSVLRYEEVDDRWDRIETLRTPRHDMGVAVIGTRIFVVGGVSSSEKQVLSDVECFDVECEHWLDDVEPLGSPALGLACVTVPGDE